MVEHQTLTVKLESPDGMIYEEAIEINKDDQIGVNRVKVQIFLERARCKTMSTIGDPCQTCNITGMIARGEHTHLACDLCRVHTKISDGCTKELCGHHQNIDGRLPCDKGDHVLCYRPVK
jgi:hypothetical protein